MASDSAPEGLAGRVGSPAASDSSAPRCDAFGRRPDVLREAYYRWGLSFALLLRERGVSLWALVDALDSPAACEWFDWRREKEMRAYLYPAYGHGEHGLRKARRALEEDGDEW